MVKINANASPEKRLFISLLTRDIPLIAAFLDLLDNSINAAIEPFSQKLQTASDYLNIYNEASPPTKTEIEVTVNAKTVQISDNAAGISTKTAVEHVFKFGRADNERYESDRLSVYGIGLKRAMFKLGNKIKMTSDHVDGGFDLDLNVSVWAKEQTQPWTFSITKRPPVSIHKTGTYIIITELYPEVQSRIDDGVFEGQLRESNSRTYSYYLEKFVSLKINSQIIEGINIKIADNTASETFSFGEVSCAITAGIGVPEGGSFREKSSGWFVFCNGRAVISADKSPLTGWGTGTGGLPIFQPKHRPFLGIVFFVSANAELLPWTTTKSALNEDSAIWQQTKRKLASVGRAVISFLDSRYTDEGTEIASKELQKVSDKSIGVLQASTIKKRVFEAPKPAPQQTTTRIQYDALIEQVQAIAQYLKRPSMSGSDIGRYTFSYFLRNEVGEN